MASQTVRDVNLSVHQQQSKGAAAAGAGAAMLSRPMVQWTLYWSALYCFALLFDSLPEWLLFERLADVLCGVFLLTFYQGLEAWTARVPEIYGRIMELLRSWLMWIAAKRPDQAVFAFLRKCYIWMLTAGGKQ